VNFAARSDMSPSSRTWRDPGHADETCPPHLGMLYSEYVSLADRGADEDDLRQSRLAGRFVSDSPGPRLLSAELKCGRIVPRP